MQIDNDMIDPGPDAYDNESFRNNIEAHIPYLITANSTYSITVSDLDLSVYEKDFFGMLTKYGVPVYKHWISMRMNRLNSPHDLPKDKYIYLIPADSELSRLKMAWETSYNNANQ